MLLIWIICPFSSSESQKGVYIVSNNYLVLPLTCYKIDVHVLCQWSSTYLLSFRRPERDEKYFLIDPHSDQGADVSYVLIP